MVLIQEDSSFTKHWPMAKIVSIFPSRNGKVWVVQVKTVNSLLNRPTSRLVLLLPQEEDIQDIGEGMAPFGGWGGGGGGEC